MDKATKLETVYDRIHEGAHALRGAQARCRDRVLARLAEGGDQAALRERRDVLLAALDDRFRLRRRLQCRRQIPVAEAAAPARDRRAALVAHAGRAQGVSRDELAPPRHAALAAAGGRDAAGGQARAPASRAAGGHRGGQPVGFRVDVPERCTTAANCTTCRSAAARHRRGSGTRSTSTWCTRSGCSASCRSRHLRAVPEIAGGHHEKMDGTGYPRRLDRTSSARSRG